MTTLIVSHIIALTKEQRYQLYNKENVCVVGVSIPVWFDKGNTSEPAKEVFVEYTLTNTSEEYAIKATKVGYEINMPQPNLYLENKLKELSPTMLEALDIEKEIPTAKNLLDEVDGGTESLRFRQFLKTNLIVDGRKTNKNLSIVHNIEIIKQETLMETI